MFLSCSVDILHDKLAGKSASSMNDKIILLHFALKFVQKSHITIPNFVSTGCRMESKKVSNSAVEPDQDPLLCYVI